MNDSYTNGLQVRRQVMGEDFVDRAFSNAGEFSRPLQDFITANAWGSIWCRSGLDLKMRSLITVAMLTALGRQHELRGHVRGALNNGASSEEIREVLLQATIYCGIPLASEAFRTVEEILSE
jgi:4-carboxymuconolactone decarboxylase